jgi:hypothetical protein
LATAFNGVVFEAFDRERSRIEGALHDGVQQDLVGAAVALQLALQLLDEDPAAARRLLEELEENMVAALERVRALGRDLYPLRAAELDAVRLGRYAPELEEAVYFAAAALEPGATRLRVWDDGGVLHLEAAGSFDDASVAQARTHVAAVGGQLEVGGDNVSATVSVSSSAR